MPSPLGQSVHFAQSSMKRIDLASIDIDTRRAVHVLRCTSTLQRHKPVRSHWFLCIDDANRCALPVLTRSTASAYAPSRSGFRAIGTRSKSVCIFQSVNVRSNTAKNTSRELAYFFKNRSDALRRSLLEFAVIRLLLSSSIKKFLNQREIPIAKAGGQNGWSLVVISAEIKALAALSSCSFRPEHTVAETTSPTATHGNTIAPFLLRSVVCHDAEGTGRPDEEKRL